MKGGVVKGDVVKWGGGEKGCGEGGGERGSVW